MIEQRDLLLVPFPFSDQSGRKVRPVVVVSNNNFNDNSEDIIVIGVTANVFKDNYTTVLSNSNLEEGKLFSVCSIKVENILKIEKELVVKKIGKVNRNILSKISVELNKIIKSS